MKKKTAFVLLAAALAAGAFFALRPDDKEAVGYLTEPVRIGDIVKTVNASGEVGAVQLVSVGAQVSGQIKNSMSNWGRRSKRGT